MKDMLKELLTSKKFLVMATTAAVTLAVRLGMDPETSEWLAAKLIPLAMAYLASQGIADFGKAKAKLHITAADAQPAASAAPAPPSA